MIPVPAGVEPQAKRGISMEVLENYRWQQCGIVGGTVRTARLLLALPWLVLLLLLGWIIEAGEEC
jgi:hypothetical protein